VVAIQTCNALRCARISWNWWKMVMTRLWTLLRLRSNSRNSFTNGLDTVCDEFNALC
jgi:hypothetical protein